MEYEWSVNLTRAPLYGEKGYTGLRLDVAVDASGLHILIGLDRLNH